MHAPEDFRSLYLDVRSREDRVLPDDVVAALPTSGHRTAHAMEWKVRSGSARRLIRALRPAPKQVLEVGCGNGWLSAHMQRAGYRVTGLDVGAVELEQARRVFNGLGVQWVLGDPWSNELRNGRYDAVVFAASFHYFPHPLALLDRCMELLQRHGEVLIIDSWVHADEGARAKARERSVAYYHKLGVPAMAHHYHHHVRAELEHAAAMAGATFELRRGPRWLGLRRIPAFPLVRLRRA